MIRNLKIAHKLILLTFTIILGAVLITIIGISNITSLDKLSQTTYESITVPLGYTGDARSYYQRMRISLYETTVSNDPGTTQTAANTAIERFNDYSNSITSYYNLKDSYTLAPNELQDITTLYNNLPTTKSMMEHVIQLSLSNQNGVAATYMMNEFRTSYDTILRDAFQGLTDSNTEQSKTAAGQAHTSAVSSTIFVLIILLVILAISVPLALAIINSVTKPINEMVQVAESLAAGELNINIRTSSKDESGMLADSFRKLVNTFRTLIDSLDSMSKEHEINGNTDVMIDSERYQGSYKSMALSVNQMVRGHVNTTNDAIHCISQIIDGSFESTIPKLPGKKIFINNAIEDLRASLKQVNAEIRDIASSAIEGDLDARVDINKYHGDWTTVMNNLNGVMEAVSTPISESADVLAEVAQGNLSVSVDGKYKGSYLIIKNSINTAVSSFSSYITEINQILESMSQGELRKNISRTYLGDFASIKESINNIIATLNQTMSEINSSSEQVLSGARQISTSSMNLAEGATEQASSVQELSASVDLISQQTQDNSQNAELANELSKKSTENAQNGNREMNEMLTAMEGIKDASNSINKIIKVIDDIAFQTNLLALNAAVEAARAGEHGKGFAVVAEEVRSLAARSQNAAKETNGLIENSITRVNDGTRIAQKTAEALNTIVENAADVSDIISKISRASKEQSEAISQVSIGLNQISRVVQSNSATSEESASASEELNSQAEVLQEMVSYFKI